MASRSSFEFGPDPGTTSSFVSTYDMPADLGVGALPAGPIEPPPELAQPEEPMELGPLPPQAHPRSLSMLGLRRDWVGKLRVHDEVCALRRRSPRAGGSGVCAARF
jgi:hypothetical protein